MGPLPVGWFPGRTPTRPDRRWDQSSRQVRPRECRRRAEASPSVRIHMMAPTSCDYRRFRRRNNAVAPFEPPGSPRNLAQRSHSYFVGFRGFSTAGRTAVFWPADEGPDVPPLLDGAPTGRLTKLSECCANSVRSALSSLAGVPSGCFAGVGRGTVTMFRRRWPGYRQDVSAGTAACWRSQQAGSSVLPAREAWRGHRAGTFVRSSALHRCAVKREE
jgi:hypothetical protein